MAGYLQGQPGAKDKAKETLYLFFTAPGNFIAANFTGQCSPSDEQLVVLLGERSSLASEVA